MKLSGGLTDTSLFKCLFWARRKKKRSWGKDGRRRGGGGGVRGVGEKQIGKVATRELKERIGLELGG